MNLTHNICVACWLEVRKTTAPKPSSLPLGDTCCWCGRLNSDGLYLRDLVAPRFCTGHQNVA